jgi:hypothetical protein
VALVLAIFSIPNGFPYHNQPEGNRSVKSKSMNAWRRVDFLGSAILFLATLALTAGFSEADSRFSWNSAYVISLITISTILWFPLIYWERLISLRGGTLEPVLPWQFLTNLPIVGILL